MGLFIVPAERIPLESRYINAQSVKPNPGVPTPKSLSLYQIEEERLIGFTPGERGGRRSLRQRIVTYNRPPPSPAHHFNHRGLGDSFCAA